MKRPIASKRVCPSSGGESTKQDNLSATHRAGETRNQRFSNYGEPQEAELRDL